jgi:hypothetical protein
VAIANVCRRHDDLLDGHDNLSLQLAAALRQLPLLRQLELSDSIFDPSSVYDTGLAAISSLTNLQALSVWGLDGTSAEGYAALPASLTLLELMQMPHLEVTGSAADSLAALTQLQHLQLQRINDLKLAAIGGLTQLTHLHLEELPRTTEQTLQQLLLLLAGLQQLRHLHVSLLLRNAEAVPAPQWTALVASTQLTYLHFTGASWQPGDCATNAIDFELKTSLDGCRSVLL